VDLRTYFKQLFERPQGEVAAAVAVRNFSIWFFALLRNFVLVGLLKYFYEKTGSALIFYIHQFALLVIFLYCLSYIDQWYVNLFGFLENKRVAHLLNLGLNLLVTLTLLWLVNEATSKIVYELSRAHAR
jgi:hypothetical protein